MQHFIKHLKHNEKNQHNTNQQTLQQQERECNPPSKFTSIRRFFSYIGSRKREYWFAIALAVGGNATLTVLIAYVNRILFQAVQFGNMELFHTACLISVLVIVISFFYPFTRYYHIRIVRVMIYELKLQLFRHLLQLNQEYSDQHHSGDAIQRIGIDAENLKTAYFTQVYVLCNLTITGITALINMLVYSVPMTCFSVVCCAVTVYLSSVMNRTIKNMSTDIQNKVSVLTEKIGNILSGFLIIRIFRGAGKILEDFDDSNDHITVEEMKRTKKLSALQMATFFTGMFASLGSVLFGAWLVYHGSADFGIVMAVVSLQINVSQTMQSFGHMLARFHVSLAQADRVFQLLEMPGVENTECSKTPDKEDVVDKGNHENNQLKGAIVFEDVSFAYPGCSPVLQHFNLELKEGQIVILAGPSGKGKSTLIKILLGLYPYQSGSVRIDHEELKEMQLSQLRSKMAYVPQNSLLFEGTILENIRAARPDATFEQVKKAAQLSFADEFIEQLPEQYETALVMGGTNLSGGQRQRIALARAFLKDAPILLLDEITSALDTESEEKIMTAVDAMRAEKTILMITHRVQTAGQYDRLIEL